jgi:hypothetical protein
MKRHAIVLLAFALACAVPVAVAGQSKKYDIETGIITYENSNTLEKFTKTYRVVLSFADYGTRECRETYSGESLKESLFSDGASRWLLVHAKKTARRQGDAQEGIEARFDWNDVPQKDKLEGKAKQLPDMTVAGKNCAVYQLSDDAGTTTIAAWDHIVLFKRETPVCGCTDNVLKAVKVEENTAVSPEKFQIPAGFTLIQ